MDGQRRIVSRDNHVEPADYADSLEPGFRFCPTDAEIIVHYLKPQIEKGTHPPCRLHKVNIYDHTPQELAEYRSCDAHWYFLTPRTRRYLNGKRPSRTTKGFGRWKASQIDVAVYDPVSKQEVGRKRSLAYFEGMNEKTPWLMHEYTTNDPNLPIGSGKNGTKLTDWVICKIYKKPGSESDKKQRVPVLNNKNREGNNEEQNNANDEPSPRRQRLSQGSSQQEASNHSGTNEHTQYQQLMFDSNQQYSGRPMGYPQPIHVQAVCDPVQAPHQMFATDEYGPNEYMSTTNTYQLPLVDFAQPPTVDMDPSWMTSTQVPWDVDFDSSEWVSFDELFTNVAVLPPPS